MRSEFPLQSPCFRETASEYPVVNVKKFEFYILELKLGRFAFCFTLCLLKKIRSLIVEYLKISSAKQKCFILVDWLLVYICFDLVNFHIMELNYKVRSPNWHWLSGSMTSPFLGVTKFLSYAHSNHWEDMLRIMKRSGVVHVSHLLFLEISFGSSLFWETNLIMLYGGLRWWWYVIHWLDSLLSLEILSKERTSSLRSSDWSWYLI